jgi:hypothetical protein
MSRVSFSENCLDSVRAVVVMVSVVVAPAAPGGLDVELKLHAAPVGRPVQAKLVTK